MPLYMAGFDCRAVPTGVRNACQFSLEQLRNCLTGLLAIDGFSKSSPQAHVVIDTEMIILSTRSRLEVYVATEAAVAGVIPAAWLLQIQGQANGDMTRHLTHRQDRDAVEHLLRIASGVEPLLLEPYILDQMVAALAVAKECGTAGPIMTHAFQHAVRIGKRAYAETDTGRCSIFHGQAVAHFLDQHHPEMANGNLLIVGASKMAHLAAQIVQRRDPQPTAFIDRTVAHAKAVKQHIPGQIFPWHQMRTALVWADAVVTAAHGLYPILDADDIAVVLEQRRGRPLLLIDLGLSHNVHPAAAAMEDVVYYDLADMRVALTDLVRTKTPPSESPGLWVASRPEIERMILEEAATLWAWIERTPHGNDC